LRRGQSCPALKAFSTWLGEGLSDLTPWTCWRVWDQGAPRSLPTHTTFSPTTPRHRLAAPGPVGLRDTPHSCSHCGRARQRPAWASIPPRRPLRKGQEHADRRRDAGQGARIEGRGTGSQAAFPPKISN